MWEKRFSKLYKGVTKQQVWRAWADVNNWSKWDSELEYCDLQEAFQDGSQFILKPKGGPKVKITLSEVNENESFIDYCQFFGAKMYDSHYLQEKEEGLLITNVISVTGPLAFLWIKLVAKNVANGVPKQTDNLVNYIKASE